MDPSSVIFCNHATLMFPGILLICLSMPFLITPSAPMTTGTICVFIPHIIAVSISSSLYLESFSATFTDVLRSYGTAMSISIHDFSFLFLIIMSDLLALMALSVWTCVSQRIVTSSFSVTVSGFYSYRLL